MKHLGERRTALGVVAGLAAVVAAGALAVTRDGDGAMRAGALGPEGVPVPDAPVLAPAREVGRGQRIDGIACQTHEQILFHIHAHVAIVVRGRARRIPAGIGIAAPREVAHTPTGPFVVGGGCFMWLHTHAADGIVHMESPVARTYTLGDFFDVWARRLDRAHVGPERGHVTAFLDGRRVEGDPRAIALAAHSQIQLDVGSPVVPVRPIKFPRGL
ncbi:MAG: hypothetical protein ACJ77E_19745 [Gaiellaceae bacterium]